MSDDAPENRSPSFTRGGVIAIAVILIVVSALVVPALLNAREAARRTQLKSNLRQIGLALHNYHDNYGQFPPGGIFNAEGEPFHSWTTSILPFTYVSPFYNEVNFHVPWNDPTQFDLFRQYPFVAEFQEPGSAALRHSSGVPLTHVAANQWLMHRNSRVQLDELTNGRENTLLVATAHGKYVPFGCPGNWREVALGPMHSPDGFGSTVRLATYVLLADGSVKAFGRDTDSQVWSVLAGPPELQPSAERVAKSEPLFVPPTHFRPRSLPPLGSEK